tara:strand:+ start:1107 stop:1946 length:840 start_codon:yes stop_codon:yes gene_type:complete
MQQLELNQPVSHDLEFHISRFLKRSESAGLYMPIRLEMADNYRKYEEKGMSLLDTIDHVKRLAELIEEGRQGILVDEVRFGGKLYNKIPSFWHDSGMLDGFIDQHDAGKKLSEKQLNCLLKMVLQARGDDKSKPKQEKSAELPNINGVYDFLNKATVQYPKIWLKLPDGTDFRINRSGDRSKYKGQLQLSNGTYGDGMYFGRISKEGDIYLMKDGPSRKDEILTLLSSLVENPEKIAKDYGRLTGNCCFCHRELSDDRSLDVGYGSTCASNYNLEWGNV